MLKYYGTLTSFLSRQRERMLRANAPDFHVAISLSRDGHRAKSVFPRRKCRWINLFDASSRPVTAGPIVPCAIGACLCLSEKLLVVDPRRASLLDDNFSIDDHCLNVRTAPVLDQRIDGIAYGSVACGSEIDYDDVCFGSRRAYGRGIGTAWL